jgi:predicted secreted acid phosphatase
VAAKYELALLFGDNLIDFAEGFEGFEGDKRKY